MEGRHQTAGKIWCMQNATWRICQAPNSPKTVTNAGVAYNPPRYEQIRVQGRLREDYYLEEAILRDGLRQEYVFEDIVILESMTRLVQDVRNAHDEKELSERLMRAFDFELGIRAVHAQVVEQDMACVGTNGKIESVFSACEGCDREGRECLFRGGGIVEVTDDTRQIAAGDQECCVEDGFGSYAEHTSSLAHSWIPHFDNARAFSTEAEETMRWINIDSVASCWFAKIATSKNKRCKEATLV